MDYTVKIGGEAGQGVQTVGAVLAAAFSRTGYHVFSHQDYESRVRGGHNFYQLRVSDKPVTASRARLDLVIALDEPSIKLNRSSLTPAGAIAYDSETMGKTVKGSALVDIPFRRLAREAGGNVIMANTVATGAALGMLGMELTVLEALLAETFRKKGEEIVAGNIRSARAGFDHARKHCRRCRFEPARPEAGPKVLLNGSEAAALGALASGLQFYAAYPMTPSTDIFTTVAEHAPDMGVVVEQAEDEVAAINMALGASFAGVRSATGSSGGGFALMVEGLSLAGMTETPVVIFEMQRPGPATGLPTRTEQGDLLFVLHAGHGEFPRVLLAPGSPEQALFLTNRAFDLAEKYQVPVFVVMDQYLADAQWTFDRIDPKGLVYKDYRLRGKRFASRKTYRRHALTRSGVSALAVPGEAPHVVVTDSDEHDEEGHIIEDEKTRNRMVEKRLGKMEAIRAGMAQPLHYGARRPELVLAGWGSAYGVLRETVDILKEQGTKAAMLFFSHLCPLPHGPYLKTLARARRTVCVEQNATSQFASLLRSETGFAFHETLNKYDGRPFSVEDILERLHA
jgi:2-oxoglutarate ferredoxin oxidoreductase subunit alpha